MDNRPYKIKRPAGVEKFILENADYTFLIFNKKTDDVVCTKKNQKIDCSATELVHNDKRFCAECDGGCRFCDNVVCKESRYGRKNMTEYGRVLWFTRKKDEVYAQLDLYKIDYTSGYAEVIYVPDQQYRISDRGCQKYSYESVYTCEGWAESWNEKKNFKLTQPEGTGCAYSLPRFHKTILYDDIAGLNVGPLKYADSCMLGQLAEMNPYSYLELLYQWAKHPAIELLYKAGFTNIVKSRAAGARSNRINWRGKTLGKILKSPPAELKKIREANLTVEDFAKYKEAKALFPTILPSFTPLLAEYGAIKSLIRITKELPADKVIRYLQDNDIHIRSYEDHLELLGKTGSKRNSGNLYPENFAQKHMELVRLYKSNKKRYIDEDIKKAAGKVAKIEYSSGNLQITAAKNSEELSEESCYLGHCVKMYADKVADGRTYIFFIRKKDEPDKPYYTLELNPRMEVVQCRGEHNCSMSDEVKAFVNEWTRFVKASIKKGVA